MSVFDESHRTRQNSDEFHNSANNEERHVFPKEQSKKILGIIILVVIGAACGYAVTSVGSTSDDSPGQVQNKNKLLYFTKTTELENLC